MATKICNTCTELKKYEDFPVQTMHSTGRGTQCKVCVSLRNQNRYKTKSIELRNQSKIWQQKHPEKIREYAAKAYKKDKAARNAITRGYQAQKLNRTPAWLSKEQKNEVAKYYQEASRLTNELGELYVVDHIVPLQGKKVSGLHVPWNLQVLRATDNCRKGNTFEAPFTKM